MRRFLRLSLIWAMGLLALAQPALSTEVPHAAVASTAIRPTNSGPGSPGPFSTV